MLQHVWLLPSFLRLNSIPLCVYTTFCLSNHLVMAVGLFPPFGYGEQCCYGHVCTCTCFNFSWRIYLGVNCWIIQSIWIQLFEEPPNCTPNWLNHFTFPKTVCENFSFSTPLSTSYFPCFHYSHHSGCERLPHCGFGLYFSFDEWCGASFHVLLGYYIFEEMSVQVLLPIFKFVCVFCCQAVNFFDIPDTRPSWDTWFASVYPIL